MEGLNSLNCNFTTKVALEAAAQVKKEYVPHKCISKHALKTFPPGYRFQPTDEELIRFYLKNKVAGKPFPDCKIYDVILYEYNPEDLREMFNLSGERDWYFFTPRQRKYRNGIRPNRAAGNGYWKATGADKPILSRGNKIGVRKALVFYKGRPPRGEKTGWIMHEYRVTNLIIEKPPPLLQADDNLQLDDWVLCKIYEKKSDEARSRRSIQPPMRDALENNEGMEMHKTNSLKDNNFCNSDDFTTNGSLGLMNGCDDQLFGPHLTVDTVDQFTPDRSFIYSDPILAQPINSVPKKKDIEFKTEDLDEVWSEFLKQDGTDGKPL